MTDIKSPIRSEVDFDRSGKHVGFLRLPHSVHRSAYGWIPLPVASIKNKTGPTVLVMAGNHGDEYEGQVIVSRLIDDLTHEMLTGQIIFLPMANFPACDAGSRTSPLDNGNLNRSFPGNPAGTPTEVIAHYIEKVLLPKVQYVVDLHSGGSSLLYDGANMLALEPRDASEGKRVLGLLAAFGLPKAVLHPPNPVTISSAARRQGSISIVTELAGAGMIASDVLNVALQGLLHFLGHVGVLHGALVPAAPPSRPKIMRIDPSIHYVYSRQEGLFEPLVGLGASVTSGQLAARIHFPESPLRPPELVYFEGAGQVICKRVPAKAIRGDCLFQLADHVPVTQNDEPMLT